MNQSVRYKFSDHDLRNEFDFAPQSVFYDLILGKLGHHESDQALKPHRVTLDAGLIQSRIELRSPRVDHDARRLSRDVWEVFQPFCK